MFWDNGNDNWGNFIFVVISGGDDWGKGFVFNNNDGNGFGDDSFCGVVIFGNGGFSDVVFFGGDGEYCGEIG